MPSTFEPSLSARLMAVFGHDRVYPNNIPILTNPSGDDDDEDENGNITCVVPAVAYRLLTERGNTCLTGTHGPYVATYLIEMFATSPDDSFQARQKLKDAFQGPVTPGNPGLGTRWLKGGPFVRWATFSDPSSGDDFPATDAHDITHFSRGVVEVLYE